MCKDVEKTLFLAPEPRKENLFLWEEGIVKLTGIEDEITNAESERDTAGHEMTEGMCCPAEGKREQDEGRTMKEEIR